MPSPRARAYCFTKNNPEEPLDEEELGCSYLLYQLEVGEEGTPHFQGLVYFSTQIAITSVIALMPGCHITVCIDLEASIKYCQKEEGRLEGPYEWGVRPVQGKRSDLTAALADVAAMKPMAEVALCHPSVYVRYYRGLTAYRTVTAKPRDKPTECISVVGPTNTGKSYDARKQWPDAFWKNKGDWWDGYDQHDVVIIDEFYGWLPFDFMLRMLDCTPLQVPTKGGFVNFVATKVVILSNRHVEDWYRGIPVECLPALKRRISQWEKLSRGPRTRRPDPIDLLVQAAAAATQNTVPMPPTPQVHFSDYATPILPIEGPYRSNLNAYDWDADLADGEGFVILPDSQVYNYDSDSDCIIEDEQNQFRKEKL